MPRPSWDEYSAQIVKDIAARSTCIRRQFGAKDEMGIESGMGHGICPAVHAEQNALIQAGKQSVGATLYVNGFPCKICSRLIVNAGIKRVMVSGGYSDEEGLKILESAGIEITYLDFSKLNKILLGAEK